MYRVGLGFRLTSPTGGLRYPSVDCYETSAMQIFVCPGIHSPTLTTQFVTALGLSQQEVLIFPSDQPVYSPQHVLDFFKPQAPVVIIAFSAGVVGAIAATRTWYDRNIPISALIAIDGWGVPLFGDFPIYRVSHDQFTHWSSKLLGGGESFYADPAVDHLTMWHSPHLVRGYVDFSNRTPNRVTTAATFILEKAGITRFQS